VIGPFSSQKVLDLFFLRKNVLDIVLTLSDTAQIMTKSINLFIIQRQKSSISSKSYELRFHKNKNKSFHTFILDY